MVLSWRGYGLLTLVFWAFSFLIHLSFFGWDADIGFTYAFLLILSASVLWIIGHKLNGDLEYYDAPHVFMRVRLQYCGLFYLIAVPYYFMA
ncbi:hypothetical protein [uncultured Psychrobacter sp.]|uniref:hypothetical protein n=1 Tax=uncultured Psychrobacter sp. TaxID=259303 RepID=UPI003458FB05